VAVELVTAGYWSSCFTCPFYTNFISIAVKAIIAGCTIWKRVILAIQCFVTGVIGAEVTIIAVVIINGRLAAKRFITGVIGAADTIITI
jgi:hypothetical protein